MSYDRARCLWHWPVDDNLLLRAALLLRVICVTFYNLPVFSVSFSLIFSISFSLALSKTPCVSNARRRNTALARISANPLITLLSDAWRNDVASGAESRWITRPMRCSAARGNNRYDTRARVTRAPRAMKRARRGRRVEIKASRDPEATTKQTLLSVANQTCILWPNGDAEWTFSGPRARIKSEIGYVSIGWAKRDYVTLEYNIWLTETFPFWLVYMTQALFASSLSFAQGLRKLIRGSYLYLLATFMRSILIRT